MRIKLLLFAGLLLTAMVAYFQSSDNELVIDEHSDLHGSHEEPDPDPVVIPAPSLSTPTYGFLCEGRLSVNVPGDEQEYPEAFSVQLDESESEAVIAGLWPSPQFLSELEPLYWSFLRQESSNILTLTGAGVTTKTSLSAIVNIDQGTGEYDIFWSVFPVGFQSPVEIWSSAGRCESFGIISNE